MVTAALPGDLAAACAFHWATHISSKMNVVAYYTPGGIQLTTLRQQTPPALRVAL